MCQLPALGSDISCRIYTQTSAVCVHRRSSKRIRKLVKITKQLFKVFGNWPENMQEIEKSLFLKHSFSKIISNLWHLIQKLHFLPLMHPSPQCRRFTLTGQSQEQVASLLLTFYLLSPPLSCKALVSLQEDSFITCPRSMFQNIYSRRG